MFPRNYFTGSFYPSGYFPGEVSVPVLPPVPVPVPSGGGGGSDPWRNDPRTYGAIARAYVEAPVARAETVFLPIILTRKSRATAGVAVPVASSRSALVGVLLRKEVSLTAKTVCPAAGTKTVFDVEPFTAKVTAQFLPLSGSLRSRFRSKIKEEEEELALLDCI